MCLATGSTLHLVEPMGFEITHSKLKRAGLDYWEHLRVVMHKSLDAFFESLPPGAPMVIVEEKAGRTIYDHAFEPGTYILFGKETTGIPDWAMNRYAGQTLRIPMYDARVRSLNLSNSVSITMYEAIRQLGA